MPNREEPKTQPGIIVEDATLVGGVDSQTGAPVVRPKTTGGRADESTVPTDPREKAEKTPKKSQ